MSKGIIIVDMPESCDMCKMGFQNEYYDRFECFFVFVKKLKNPEECKPDWCPIQPKRKRLLDIAMEQDDIDVSEIECPSEVRPEFQPYEKQCSRMSCVQCWGQEVDE